ncbi:MAG TPA: hypothetical protein VMS01_06425 [Stellaceae bacterium]|nr:hypothetical protein [Stellaceae bacterium]
MLAAFLSGGATAVVPLVPSRLAPGSSFVEPPPFWERTLAEFKLLICTEDQKYEELRQQLRAAAEGAKKPSTQIIAALIAGGIGK